MSDEIPNNVSDSQDFLSASEAKNKPGAKRRASRAGTRSVASLTPEQLARKRANDREAQRSIRQRTKTHIEDLERRIKELSGDQDARNIEEIQRRNVELEEELRTLRETLVTNRSEGSVASSPEPTPLPARYGMQQHFTYSPQWPQNSPGSSSSSSSYPTSSAGDLLTSMIPDYSSLDYAYSDPSSATSDSFNISPVLSDVVPSPVNMNAISAARRGAPFNPRPHFGRSRSYPHGRIGNAWQGGSPPSSITSQPMVSINTSPMMNGVAPCSAPNQSMPLHNHALPILNTKPNGIGPSPLSNHQSSPPDNPIAGNRSIFREEGRMSSIRTSQPQGVTIQTETTSTWEAQLCLAPPDDPVDHILFGLAQRQREVARNGGSRAAVIGPYHPNLRRLVNTEEADSVHPTSSIIGDLLLRTALRSFPTRAGAMLLVYHFMQWQILPSATTFNNIPEWFRPRPAQLMTTHCLWQSMLIWPRLRDVVIGNPEKYTADEFLHLYGCSLNINWPFRESDSVIMEGGEVRATADFLRHAQTLENWSMDEPFQRRYPELRDICRFTTL